MSVGSNTLQSDGNPRTGPFFDFRTTGKEQRLYISPSYSSMGGVLEDL